MLKHYGLERAIMQGHDAWGWNGPNARNPYNRYFTGAWAHGHKEARKGRSQYQAILEWKRLGYDTGFSDA